MDSEIIIALGNVAIETSTEIDFICNDCEKNGKKGEAGREDSKKGENSKENNEIKGSENQSCNAGHANADAERGQIKSERAEAVILLNWCSGYEYEINHILEASPEYFIIFS